MSVLFTDRAWWLWVNPDVSTRRLIDIEMALAPVLRARLLSLLEQRLDEDAT